jgi:hypothetical protein
MPPIFISHSTRNDDFARFLADHLVTAGFDVWLDEDAIRSGERWLARLQSAIEACGAFIVVMSRAARDSEWVERETLLAMDLKKPLYVALIEDMPLPLHLINRQYTRCQEDRERCARKLAAALRRIDLSAPPKRTPRKLSPEPDRDNFFKYLEQLPGGEESARIARELFAWAREYADLVDFGGKISPGLHVRLRLDGVEVTVCSVWAYPRRPAVQIQFQYLADHPPYDDANLRRSTLNSLNRLSDKTLIEDKADRRPTIPLQALAGPDKLALFVEIMAEIIDNLRSV